MKPNVREHEVITAILALSQRHNLDLITILGVMKLFKGFINQNTLPTTKMGLWRRLNRVEENFQIRYPYCKECRDVIGVGKERFNDCECGLSGPEKPLKFSSYFIQLNMKMQLRRILSTPDFHQLLDYRMNRQKIHLNGIEDIFDGERYKNLRRIGQFLHSNWNFSFTINTDGCQVGKSSKHSAWPILLSINELPPHARKRFIILAGIWIDEKHPDLTIYMRPIIEELRELFHTGIEWRSNGIERITSKFIVTTCSVDTPARSQILNMTRYNGRNGCSFCYAPGIRLENGARVYPIEDIVNRTDREIREDMTEATRTRSKVRGVKANSILRCLQQFDLRRGVVVDSMHCVDIGVVKKLTELVLYSRTAVPWHCGNARMRRRINERLTKIRTPSRLARKPRGIEYYHLWKASEWRNWILYYCIPCLTDLIPDIYLDLFRMLSEALNILNGDTMTLEEIERAQRLIDDFATQYEERYGLVNMSINIHLLRHLCETVKHWGPLWVHNVYKFESFNRQILNSLHSSNGRQLQIMNRYLLNEYIRYVMKSPDFNDLTKQTIRDIWNNGKKTLCQGDIDYEHYNDFRAFGITQSRNAYNWENDLLIEQGLVCNGRLNISKKVFYKGTLYTSVEGDKKDNRSCDKYIYTIDGRFAEILSIVSYQTNDGNTINGLFIKWFENTGNLQGAAHIRSLRFSTRGFVEIKNVRVPVIIFKYNDTIYGMKISNVWETD
ncbi:uncharacterized protein [Venturia canescens]|uniref:uncharacterized protein n=1 Tax=Venturia canescens TaxID=32260 RepID=UPI001C9D3392|nr:uncharacterized protein LOC122408037 [Venturia canescens]